MATGNDGVINCRQAPAEMRASRDLLRHGIWAGFGMAKPLDPPEIATALATLPGWTRDGDVLTKTFKFGSFREAMSFMVRVGFEAEGMDHHPDWTNVYNRVVIRLNTHDAGDKVTAKDVELARKIQAISWVG
jgi:4a-hydroxytetrahydrobiopterin dehydratase